MIFFKHHEDKITINDQVIDFFVFLKLEPDYEMPTKAKTVTYIPGKLYSWSDGKTDYNLGATWPQGDRYISRLDEFLMLQKEEDLDNQDTEKLVRDEREKRLEYDRKRKLEYPKIEELVIAMWEKLIEKKTLDESGVKEIQAIREKIKTDYPKSEELRSTKKSARKKVRRRNG
tara:strand:- start:153 stop:671 length:519 start_codon:yes stop_codon:yes gene_type:complete